MYALYLSFCDTDRIHLPLVHWAAAHKSIEIAELLIKHADVATLDAQNNRGQTALFIGM